MNRKISLLTACILIGFLFIGCGTKYVTTSVYDEFSITHPSLKSSDSNGNYSFYCDPALPVDFVNFMKYPEGLVFSDLSRTFSEGDQVTDTIKFKEMKIGSYDAFYIESSLKDKPESITKKVCISLDSGIYSISGNYKTGEKEEDIINKMLDSICLSDGSTKVFGSVD